jgi:hypothetical protein
MEKLQDILNDWILKNNIKEIEFRFSNNSSLFDDESITNMKLVYFYINKKEEATKEDNDLKTSISNHIVESWKINRDKEREEFRKSGKKYLKYEITPEMLEYKGYNKTKFKNIEGLYGLMQMN